MDFNDKMIELNNKLNLDDSGSRDLRDFLIMFSCYSEKTPKEFAEMILKEMKYSLTEDEI